jgi:hypothetical protein
VSSSAKRRSASAWSAWSASRKAFERSTSIRGARHPGRRSSLPATVTLGATRGFGGGASSCFPQPPAASAIAIAMPHMRVVGAFVRKTSPACGRCRRVHGK